MYIVSCTWMEITFILTGWKNVLVPFTCYESDLKINYLKNGRIYKPPLINIQLILNFNIRFF